MIIIRTTVEQVVGCLRLAGESSLHHSRHEASRRFHSNRRQVVIRSNLSQISAGCSQTFLEQSQARFSCDLSHQISIDRNAQMML